MPRNHPYQPASSSPPWYPYYCLLKMKSYCRPSYQSILLLRAKHQSQTSGSYWKARPAEQAAVHGSLLQSHRGPSPQYSLHGREAKEPESIKNAKEPGSFPGVEHCRYGVDCWVPVSGHGIMWEWFLPHSVCLLSLWSTTSVQLLV